MKLLSRALPALVVVLAAPGFAPAQDARLTAGGSSGLVTLPDTSTLPRGTAAGGLAMDNRDRDPLGLDLLDASLTLTAGLGSTVEAYAQGVVSRVVSVPELPPMPPPPLDVVIAPGAVAPPRPRYALFPPTPYVNKRGTARFDDWVPGDLTVGAKARLMEGAGARPAFALAGELKAPLTRSETDLMSGSGTGGWDGALRAIAQWGLDPLLTASVRYTRVGRPARGDRDIAIDAQGRAAAVDLDLDLPDRLELGLGARRTIGARAAAILETSAAFAIGSRTPTVDESWPLDVLGGVQARFGGARFTVGVRYHGHALPSGERRVSPVGGMIDLTSVPDAELVSYLETVGAGAAAPLLRSRTQRILAVRNAGPLPAGARVLPVEYGIRSEHQVGVVMTLAWVFE
jgi:hypothetical protein